jgi:FkbM family methyltransferase
MSNSNTIDSPVYKQLLQTNLDYIYNNSIIQNQLWEPHICSQICQFLEDDTDFVDIGANIGLITLGVKIMNETIKNKKINKIHCFECCHEIFGFLKFNMKNNDDIKLYNFALGDKHELANLCFNNYNNGNTMIKTTYENVLPVDHPRGYGNELLMDLKYENNVYIPVVPLDSLIDNFDKRVSVIKIDVEGFEYNVLFGACKFIEKHKPIIIIEIIPSKYEPTHNLLVKYNYVQIAQTTLQDFIYAPISFLGNK